MLTPHSEASSFVWFHRLLDIILPLVILKFIAIFFSVEWHDRYLILGLMGGMILVTASQFVGIYQNWRGRSINSSILLVLKAWLLTWAVLIILAFLLKDAINLSRLTVVTWMLLTFISLIGYRILLRVALGYFRTKGSNNRKIAIAGAGKVGQHLAMVVESNPWLGYTIVGFFDDNPSVFNSSVKRQTLLGGVEQIIDQSLNYKFDELYICLPLSAEKKIKKLFDDLSDTTLIVKFIPDLFTFDLIHAHWVDLKGLPVISVYDTPINSATSRAIKRLEDVIATICILLVIFPFMLIIALGVKLSSPGPVIFKQKRYGLNGKEINVYKFRTMTALENGQNIKQAEKNDTRITKFGRFLRRTSLDELPQFINVLQGKMSIVGPRPHASAHNELYRKLVPKYMQRHIVKPGITGWAQINGWRGETDTLDKMEKRIEYDLHYIHNWSLWFDIKIILLTIFKGFWGKNVY